MKKISLLLVFASFIFSVKAQTYQIQNTYTVDSMLLNFAVPDLPAFKALGTNPSNILRPSDLSKFAVMINPFLSDGKAILPKAFALEFAPWKIASRDWTISQYREDWIKRALYNSSFSLGTVSEDKEEVKTKVAMGYRVKLLGKQADLLTSDELPSVHALNAQELLLKIRSQDNWIQHIKKTDRINFSNSVSMQTEFDTYFLDSIGTSVVTQAIQDFKKNNWNASRLDLALAIVGASSDSLAENTEYESFQVWLTQAVRICKIGQLLLGGSMNASEDGTTDFTFNGRLYFGNSDVRAYGEYQYKRDESAFATINSSLLNLGGEFRVGKKIWIDFYGGVQNFKGDADASRFKTSLSVKYALNEK